MEGRISKKGPIQVKGFILIVLFTPLFKVKKNNPGVEILVTTGQPLVFFAKKRTIFDSCNGFTLEIEIPEVFQTFPNYSVTVKIKGPVYLWKE